jgi:hypothetical protein
MNRVFKSPLLRAFNQFTAYLLNSHIISCNRPVWSIARDFFFKEKMVEVAGVNSTHGASLIGVFNHIG